MKHVRCRSHGKILPMKHSPEYNEVKAILKDVAERQQRAEKRLAEERQKDNERHENELKSKTARQMTETDRHLAEAERNITENRYLSQYTANDFEYLDKKFAEALREVRQLGKIKLLQVEVGMGIGKFNVVAIGDDAVIVGKVNAKLSHSDVLHFVKHRLPDFVKYCPSVSRNRRIYGMLGARTMTEAAKAAAKRHGLFITRLEGEKLVVDYARARMFSPALSNAKPWVLEVVEGCSK